MKLMAPDLNIQILQDTYPGMSSLACASRTFITYDECISSAKKLMDDLLQKADKNIFKMGSEVNPIYSGQPTLSKDWAAGEISRLWIYDKKMERSGQIHAVGQARIFAQVGQQPVVQLN